MSDFLVNLGQAFFFVVLVMFLFAGWRIAVVVGVLVPSATLVCFALMPQFGVQLEMMSIAALIIALGLLVDNAVERLCQNMETADFRFQQQSIGLAKMVRRAARHVASRRNSALTGTTIPPPAPPPPPPPNHALDG